MTRPPDISWLRAAKHGGIAFGLLLLLSLLPMLVTDIADPHRYGEGVGRLGTFVFLGVMGASAARQREMRRTAVILAAVSAALVVLAAALVGAAIL